MEEERIDLGQWTCPRSWDELTVKKFQAIQEYYKDDEDKKFDVRDVIHILCDKTIDEVNALPMEFTNTILEHMEFLLTPMKEQEPSNKIEISGTTYLVNPTNKLKTGEYVAVDTVIKDNPRNFAAILAILCRKEGEVYDSHYENEILEERLKMWEEQPITKVMPIVSFFLQLYLVSQMPIRLSSAMQEEINYIRENIKNSRENGEISAFSTRRLMRKLKKLEKSINSI